MIHDHDNSEQPEPDGYMFDTETGERHGYYHTAKGPIRVDTEEGAAEAARRQMERDTSFYESMDWFSYFSDDDERAHQVIHKIIEIIDSIAHSREPRARAAFLSGIYHHHHFLMYDVPAEVKRSEEALADMAGIVEEDSGTDPWHDQLEVVQDDESEDDRRFRLLQLNPVVVTEDACNEGEDFCATCKVGVNGYHRLDCGTLAFDEHKNAWWERI